MSASDIDERLLSERGDEDPHTVVLRRASASGRFPERAAALARLVFDLDDARGPLAASILAQLLRGAGASELRSLDRDYRSPRFIRQWEVLAELDGTLWRSRLSLDHESRLAALAIGSVQRNGHVREEAVREIGARTEHVAAGLLFLRVNDPVPQVASAAIAFLERWRMSTRALHVARYLPLVESLEHWVRASQTDVWRDWYRLFDRDEAALLSCAEADDEALRASALRRLAALRAGRESMQEVLDLAIDDMSPRIRRWTAMVAADGGFTPHAVRDRFVGRMWEDRNPRIREIALRYLRRLEDGDRHVEAAVLDPNAGVRHHARRYAHRMHLAIPYREQALQILVDDAADRRALIGALALLSDNGTRADSTNVRPFLEHPHRDVRREARRTMALLEG